MATYAIGDVQGCYEPLCRLLEKIGFDDRVDRLWFAGDLINRGPKSLEVLRLVKSLSFCTKVTLGNHDLHALAVFHRAVRKKAKDTLDALLESPDASELFDWLRQCPLFHLDQSLEFAMVHAGVIPDWDSTTAWLRAREVEVELASHDPAPFLTEMYGDTPARYTDELCGNARLRAITNVLTRMRFCKDDGTLDLTRKGDMSDAPTGYLPWFLHPHRKTRDEKIIFGHWATLKGVTQTGTAIATDTACVWGECLTAFCLEDGTRFSVGCPQAAG